MTMIEGMSLKGLRLEGRKTLQSIGNMITWNDYRKGFRDTGGFTRIPDLTGRGNTLSYTANTAVALFSDGYFYNNTACQFNFAGGGRVINVLGTGVPCLYYAVMNVNDLSPLAYAFMFSSGNTTSGSGTYLGVNFQAGMCMQIRVAGAIHTGPVLPNNGSFFLLRYICYGSGAGTGNYKLCAAASSALITRAGAPLGGVASAARLANANDAFRIKFHAAYDCTGKTKAEVDAIDADFITVLKQDAEYASLIT